MNVLSSRGDRRFVVGMVSGGHFMSHFYLLAFPPLFPLVRDTFGLSNTELGLIVSMVMLPPLVLQIPVGQLVDRVGAKRVFVVGLALTGAATTVAGLVPTYPLLLAVALLAGVGQSAFHPSDYALLSAVVDDENEGKGFSVHTFGGFVGFAAAPVVIGGIGVAVNWRAALLLAGSVGVLYALVAQLTLDTVYLDQLGTTETGGSSSSIAEIRGLLTPELTLLFLFYMLLFMAGTGIQSFTTVFLVSTYGLPETIGNSVLTTYFALSAVGILVGGMVADRYDIHAIIGVTMGIATALTAVLAVRALPSTALVAFAGFGTIGFLTGSMRPSRDSLVSLHSPSDSSGRSFGFVFSGGSLGGFVSPVLLGYLIDAVSIELAVLCIAAFFLACALIATGVKLHETSVDESPGIGTTE